MTDEDDLPSVDETPIQFATRPSESSRGWVVHRRATAINLVNYQSANSPTSFIRLLRTLSTVYNDEAGEVLDAIAADLEHAYEEDYLP